MTLFQQTILAIIFGACVGSFLNVIHLRFGQWRSIAVTRSTCPHCRHELAWYDLVPIVSFITLLGHCRYCKKPISGQYIVIEALCGGITAIVWYVLAPHSLLGLAHTAGLLLFVYAALVMILQDAKDMEVHNILFMVTALGALVFAIGNGVVNAALGVVSTSIVLLIVTVVSRERWMGSGDVLLAVPIGMILGYPKGLLWMYLSFMLGAAYGIFLILVRRKKRTDPVPFIPIMLLGFLITFLYGDRIINWYLHQFL